MLTEQVKRSTYKTITDKAWYSCFLLSPPTIVLVVTYTSMAMKMPDQIASPVVNAMGKTRLRESLERARARKGPSMGQWLEFPGYTLAKTVAALGEDVSSICQGLSHLAGSDFGRSHSHFAQND